MKQAFRCEWFKLRKSLALKLTVLIMLVLAAVTSLSNLSFDESLARALEVSQTGCDAFFMALRDTPTITLLGVILVGILIGGDSVNRYLQTVLFSGVSRTALVFVKSMLVYGCLLGTYLIYVLGRTVIQTGGSGFGAAFTPGVLCYLLAFFFVTMLAHCSLIGLSILIAFSLRSPVLASGVSVLALVFGGSVLLSFGASTPWLGKILALTPFGMGKELAFTRPACPALWAYAALALLFIIAEGAATALLFRRAELK